MYKGMGIPVHTRYIQIDHHMTKIFARRLIQICEPKLKSNHLLTNWAIWSLLYITLPPMTPDIDFTNGYLSGASVDILVAQVQIYLHGPCSVASIWRVGRFIHPMHVQIYPCTFEYIHAMHIQIYLWNTRPDISMQCTSRYIRAMWTTPHTGLSFLRHRFGI